MALIENLFENRLISKGFSPPRSRNLTTPNFFLWDFLRDSEYVFVPMRSASFNATIYYSLINVVDSLNMAFLNVVKMIIAHRMTEKKNFRDKAILCQIQC